MLLFLGLQLRRLELDRDALRPDLPSFLLFDGPALRLRLARPASLDLLRFDFDRRDVERFFLPFAERERFDFERERFDFDPRDLDRFDLDLDLAFFFVRGDFRDCVRSELEEELVVEERRLGFALLLLLERDLLGLFLVELEELDLLRTRADSDRFLGLFASTAGSRRPLLRLRCFSPPSQSLPPSMAMEVFPYREAPLPLTVRCTAGFSTRGASAGS